MGFRGPKAHSNRPGGLSHIGPRRISNLRGVSRESERCTHVPRGCQIRHMEMRLMRRSALLLYLSSSANVAAFFHKPLFNSDYLFPWVFRGVQLPLIACLTEELRHGRFALWNPYSYCGYPVFATLRRAIFIRGSCWRADRCRILPPICPIARMGRSAASMGSGHCHLPFSARVECRARAGMGGAIIFETGGYFASRAEHIGAMMAVAWMPLAWLAVLKLRREFQFRWFAALCAALGCRFWADFHNPRWQCLRPPWCWPSFWWSGGWLYRGW